MIIPDHEIRRLCLEEDMVIPYDPELQNPASLDVLLGERLMVEVPHTDELQICNIADCTESDPYLLAPGDFVLAETQEVFNLPEDVVAKFFLKSSRARSGLNHLLAGFCDNGWHGSVLTLELQNVRRLHSIPLYPGLKIGQMAFYKLQAASERTYAATGRYNNHRTVHPSLG